MPQLKPYTNTHNDINNDKFLHIFEVNFTQAIRLLRFIDCEQFGIYYYEVNIKIYWPV